MTLNLHYIHNCLSPPRMYLVPVARLQLVKSPSQSATSHLHLSIHSLIETCCCFHTMSFDYLTCFSLLLPCYSFALATMSSGGGLSTAPYLAVAACTVSLTALVCSTAQLLCQYLATTDQYRRCQASVMGPWAQQTRLRWNWSKFRFETLFAVPEIILCNGGNDEEVELITGSAGSRSRTYVSPIPVDPPHMYQALPTSPDPRKSAYGHTTSLNGEMACWLGLLETLHEHEGEVRSLEGYHGLVGGEKQPAVRIKQRAWDFMSPDAIRPHAVSNLGDIAILTRRLGMTWSDFREYSFFLLSMSTASTGEAFVGGRGGLRI